MKRSMSFHKGDRCRIKDWVDPAMYGDMTRVGNEGWIKDVSQDKWGFDIVYIEWDRNHWAYNGAKDGWTFADHFDKIASLDMGNNDREIDAIIKEFSARIATALDEADGGVEPPRLELLPASETLAQEVEDNADRRDQALRDAFSHLRGCEAFVIVGVERKDDDRAPDGMLMPISMRFSETDDAEIVAEAFLSTLAMESHHAMSLQLLTDLYEGDEEG